MNLDANNEQSGRGRVQTTDITQPRMPHGERVPSLTDASEYMVLAVINDGSDKYYMDWDWLRFHA